MVPNLSGRRLDVYYTSTHGVALSDILVIEIILVIVIVSFCLIIMAALCNRGAIIFLPCSFFPSSFFFLLFFPRLISAAVDRMSAILLHMAWP